MSIAETIKQECKKQSIPVSRLEKDLGFCNGYVRGLKEKIPMDRAQKIAEYLQGPISVFTSDAVVTMNEELPEDEMYYLKKEIAAYAQELANRPGMKTLLDASRNLSEEDLEIVNQLVLKLTSK